VSVCVCAEDLATKVTVTLLTASKAPANEMQTRVLINTQLLQSLMATTSTDTVTDQCDMELPLPDKELLQSLEKDLVQNRGLLKTLVRIIIKSSNNITMMIVYITATDSC